MMDTKTNIISEQATIKNALEQLNTFTRKDSLTLFVLNGSNQLVGTVTDGDIRRALVAGISVDDKISACMYRNFRYIERNKFTLEYIEGLKQDEIGLLPLVNEKKEIIKLIDLSHKLSILPLDAVIMAGGEGKRLKPLTDKIPKPLIRVGDKPILEHNIDRLNSYGIDRIFITVKYLSEQIISYFGDGNKKGLTISYTTESDSLGTLGALSLIDNFEHDHILVMNSDLLTNIDFTDLYKSFLNESADMIVASVPYNVDIPYGVIETHGAKVKTIKEKPRYTYYSNAGIYILKKKLLEYIPKNTFFNATDLMELALEKQFNLVHYPIREYWLDIGKHEDYAKAQEDIKHIKL
jgi:dTDP-glucose pyrophosphorylase